MKLFCKHCAQKVSPVLTASGPHHKACCPECGRYIQFVKHGKSSPKRREPNVRMLNPGDRGYATPPTYRRKIRRVD